MNLQQLRAFVAVLERQSFTLAAHDLAITQPAVSQQIRTLERHCRLRLIDRAKGRIVPTPAGEALYRYARALLQTYDEAERVIAELRSNQSMTTKPLAMGSRTTTFTTRQARARSDRAN